MSLELVEIKPGSVWQVDLLRKILKSPKWVVRFGALKQLNAVELGTLMRLLFPKEDLVQVLLNEAHLHSGHLQGYIIDLTYEHGVVPGAVRVDTDPEPDDIDKMLAEMVEQFEVKVVGDVEELVEGLEGALGSMSGKQARVRIKQLAKMNRRNRRQVGVTEVILDHRGHLPNLVIFDVSGSMGRRTVEALVAAVKALAVSIDAHLVIVSNVAKHWNPGEFTVPGVLAEAEFGGTHYEQLAPLMDEDWGVVVTLADYDSGWGVKDMMKDRTGSIELLLDISVVDRPTYLAEVLVPLAKESRPIVVAKTTLTYDY